jgi:hypothetical protein
MPSKTKNRRANGNKRRGKRTRSQRGGDIWHTLSLGAFGTADPTTQTWSEWFGINSGKGWLESLTSSSPTTNPIQSSYEPSSNVPESSLSNSDFNQNTTMQDTTMQDTEYNGYNGGKKSKSRSCHRKHRHKHTKSCSK